MDENVLRMQEYAVHVVEAGPVLAVILKYALAVAETYIITMALCTMYALSKED